MPRLPGRRSDFYEALRERLKGFAERSFALSATDADGVSYRETLEGLLSRSVSPEKRAGYEAELACPPCPPAAAYLWQAFVRLHGRRGSSGMGVDPITWSDLDAFTRLSGLRLTPWEIEAIEELDDLWRTEHAKARKAAKG